jgi:WD40 repeat protein
MLPTTDSQPTTDRSFYVSGGTLRADASCYVERQADVELYDGITRGEFCYVLTSRQMGKSSLMICTAARLRQEGMHVVVLDLTAIGQNLAPAQWYDGLLGRLAHQLDLEEELEAFWEEHERFGPLQRWMAALQDVVLRHCAGQVVIFVDEIDAVRSLPFSADEFFAAIRECYTRRAEDPRYHRLTFCLLGVAIPSDLIQDERTTPFNVGRRIELNDFTEAEAAALARGLGTVGMTANGQDGEREGRHLLERVLYWTGGHPYLTQRLCQAVAEEVAAFTHSRVPTIPSLVDRQCEALFLSAAAQEADDNLQFVRKGMLRRDVDQAALLELYGQVGRGRRVRVDDTNPLIGLLRLSGVVRVTDGLLRVRNRIYARVFDRAWVTQHIPDAEVRRQRAAYRRGLLRAATLAAVVLAVVSGLALIVRSQARRAWRVLSQAQSERGVRLLQDGDSNGLLNLLQAYQTASDLPQARESAATVRTWWYPTVAGQLLQVMGHEDGIETLAISPDGKLLATGSLDGTARLWESATGRPHGTPLRHEGSVRSVAFSPDGKLLATASDDRTVRLWDVVTRQPHGAPLTHEAAVSGVKFSPDGRLLVTGSDDDRVQLWETVTGRRRGKPMIRDEYALTDAVFSPDGTLVATSGRGEAGNEVQIWETDSGRLRGRLTGGSIGFPIGFSSDGKRLAVQETPTAGFVVRLYDTRSLRTDWRLTGHNAGILAGAFSPDGTLFATSSYDSTARLWDVREGRAHGEPLRHRGPVSKVAFSPNGKLVATASTDGTARLWSTRDGRPHGRPLQHQGAVTGLAFTPDSTIRLWDTDSGTPRGQPLRHDSPVFALTVSPDGRFVVGGCLDGTVQLWEIATGRPWGRSSGPWGPISIATPSVLFRPADGVLVSSVARDGTVRMWDPETVQTRGQLLRHAAGIGAMAFSRDGKLLATAANDNLVRLWDAVTGRPRGRPLRYTNRIVRVAFSPDDRLLATCSTDGKAQIWDIHSRLPCGPSVVHGNPIWAAEFSPDGRLLATASSDFTARLWRLTTRSYGAQEMEFLTWIALGARLDQETDPAAIPWHEWRRFSDEVQGSEREASQTY